MIFRAVPLILVASLLLAGCGRERPAPLVGTIASGPNAGLSNAGTVWHLRGALNVAALKCGGEAVQRYNAALKIHERAFRRAQRRLQREFRREGGDWQTRFDAAQTRLYNYIAHPRGERAFCAAAKPVLAEIGAVPRDGFTAFAARALIALDRPLAAGQSFPAH